MTNQPLTIAIEGTCCAGKTTLAHGLAEESFALSITYVRDYSDHVGGGKFLPPPVPASLAEEKIILNRFLEIEADRTTSARLTAGSDLIIIDRSIQTLMAHCFALCRLLDDDYFGLARRVIGESSVPLWPDHVLYLDVPQCVIEARNGGKFAPDSIFIDVGFNAGVRSYFQQMALLPSPRVVWLDATGDATMVRGLAAAQIEEWRGLQDCT